jgi:hypothetical protein
LTGVVNGAADGTDADAGFIASVADEHPALAGFGDGHFGNLSAVRFTTRYDLEAPPDDVLMRAPDGDALMAEKRFGRGRVLLFAGSLDRDWTNFPMQATFVPWVYRLVGYMAQGGLASAGFVRTGQVVTLPSSASQVESLQVETPDGAIAYPEPSADASGTGTMELAGTERAGVYAVRSAMQKADEPRLLFAANTPSEEAEPQRFDRDGVAALLAPEAAANFDFLVADGTAVDFGQVGRSNYGLWNTLLFLALLVGLFEPWLANKLSRKRAEQVKDALGQRDAIAGTPKPSLTPERTAA